ncbi:hypothetical protein HY626_04285 [Candidatus Uhrbacteria bacterium]|nr:hypothetical protein [Candidatus Uhrbacteria bacterium]
MQKINHTRGWAMLEYLLIAAAVILAVMGIGNLVTARLINPQGTGLFDVSIQAIQTP